MWQSAHNQPSKHFPIINRKVFLIISRRGKHPADIIYIRVIETGLCKGQRNSIEIKPKKQKGKRSYSKASSHSEIWRKGKYFFARLITPANQSF
jgi:hypothetical protein